MDFNSFKTSEKLEVEGVWKNFTPDARVKVARFNNPKYRVALAKALKPYQGFIKVDPIVKEQLMEKITTQVMAETILLDWENFTIDGEKIEYSVENATLVLSQFHDFREQVSNIAIEMDNYKDEIEVVGGK